jgi:hypothetical protein
MLLYKKMKKKKYQNENQFLFIHGRKLSTPMRTTRSTSAKITSTSSQIPKFNDNKELNQNEFQFKKHDSSTNFL